MAVIFMDFNQFQKLGFSNNEVLVYLFLVENGENSAHTLAKQLHLPRSTVYSVLDALEIRQLVGKKNRKRATHYVAHNPAALTDSIEKKQKQLREQHSIAKSLIDEISPLIKHPSYELPKVEFFEGATKVERFLFDNLERWRDSILRHDESTWGYQDHTLIEQFPKWFKRAWQVLHIDAGITGKILSNRSSIEKSLRGKISKREVRVLGKNLSFESSTWVMGDYVVVAMTRRAPMYAFQIHEPLLAANLRLLFQNLYENAQVE